MNLSDNDRALLLEVAHSYQLPGYPDALRKRGAELLRQLAAHPSGAAAGGAGAGVSLQGLPKYLRQCADELESFDTSIADASLDRATLRGWASAIDALLSTPQPSADEARDAARKDGAK
jgi:hypothetical protein